jgi:C-terminal peptidase prc
LSLVLALVVGAGVAAPAGAQWREPSNCSIASQNLFVRDVLTDLYYWNTQLAPLNPVSFGSPDAYLEAVKYHPLDQTFSYVGYRAASDAFYSASQYIGLGYSAVLGDTEYRLTQVFPESPASEAGMARGDRIVAIGGVPIADLIASGRVGTAVGPSTEGVQVTMAFERADGTRVEASMTKRPVTMPTVMATQVYEVDGRRVGYVFFRNFVEPSVEALDVAFAALREAKAQELVLDLRYNGGGLVSVAQHLASLIGGTRASGQILAEYFHNEQNAFRNRILRFEDKEQALTLDRLVVITTRGTASASELVINALRPLMPVVIVGDTTYGKPVGQYGINFCDRVLFPVAFTLRNALQEGDYFGGMAPSCVAGDDLDRQIGDPEEASLREALRFVRTGECDAPAPPTTAEARRARSIVRDRAVRKGLDQIINAY